MTPVTCRHILMNMIIIIKIQNFITEGKSKCIIIVIVLVKFSHQHLEIKNADLSCSLPAHPAEDQSPLYMCASVVRLIVVVPIEQGDGLKLWQTD